MLVYVMNSRPNIFDRPDRQTKRRHRSGLSLVEMVIVIAILAALASVAVPRYSLALQRYHAAAAGQRIAADLALAQTLGKTTSAGQPVAFSVINNNYQLTGYAGFMGGAAQTSYTVSLAASPYNATLVSASFNSTTQVTFDRFGQPDNGGTVVVQVGTVQKTITVDGNSGKVTVQ
jgi:prepilin-type N-terminal cleavage/methylation domain-containing protein